ncbi:helix-turn-helix domain-containing protein [Streptomyces pakalii]|uniref:Helix-turn-helix transcriptional regulator n=1 Tax=Streptomyces pakalii TaxID=3036494 RepID=A0ABT7DHH8_9ACTN|nr:helix-turn-helix transcriptional regulator [Streptomyces pakalii]MDJ1645271.1 helix-turn-helix transcriptional regulator [Streptomyces pakalii]
MTRVDPPDSADRAVARALRTGPFDLALRMAVRASGLSLERLAHRLTTRGIHVSASSLSNWQTGRSRPERAESVHALRALEQILGLPRDGLIQLLGPRRPRGRWLDHVPGSVSYDAIFDDHARLTRMMAAGGFADPDRYAYRTVEDRVTLDSAGVVRRIEVRNLVSALVDGVDGCVVYYRADDGSHPEVRPVEGCRLGRTRVDEASGFLVAELLFDHRLDRGDVQLIAFDQHFTTVRARPGTSDHYYKAFRAPCPGYLLRVAFHPDAVPVRLRSFRADRWGDEPTEEHALPCHRNRVTHVHIPDVPPGVVGVRWEWT